MKSLPSLKIAVWGIGEKVNRLVLVTTPDVHFRSAGVDVAFGGEGIGDQYEMI